MPADDEQKPKPKRGGISLGQWSGSDATDKLRKALTGDKTEARLLAWITAFLALAAVIVPIWLAYHPPNLSSDRRLTESQKVKLNAELLKITPPIPEIFVAQVNGDNETAQYAADFRDAFRRVGIFPQPGWTDRPDSAAQVGVIIAVRDAGLIPEAVRQLRTALRNAGVDAQVRPFPQAGFDPRDRVKDLVLYIAPRPL